MMKINEYLSKKIASYYTKWELVCSTNIKDKSLILINLAEEEKFYAWLLRLVAFGELTTINDIRTLLLSQLNDKNALLALDMLCDLDNDEFEI